MQRLVGERVGPGWRETVRRKIGRLETCTHLMELLGPAVTTLYQTMSYGKKPEGRDTLENQQNSGERPFFIGGCHSWRTDGPIVAAMFPQFATKPAAKEHLMTRPLSNDLRERVVAAVTGGESCRAVASRFGVAVSSVVKWSQRYRATGSVAPGKMGGHRKRVLEPHRAFILERISQTPHLTLHGLKDELAARGVKVSHNAVWLFLRREGLRFKKNTVRP